MCYELYYAPLPSRSDRLQYLNWSYPFWAPPLKCKFGIDYWYDSNLFKRISYITNRMQFPPNSSTEHIYVTVSLMGPSATYSHSLFAISFKWHAYATQCNATRRKWRAQCRTNIEITHNVPMSGSWTRMYPIMFRSNLSLSLSLSSLLLVMWNCVETSCFYFFGIFKKFGFLRFDFGYEIYVSV